MGCWCRITRGGVCGLGRVWVKASDGGLRSTPWGKDSRRICRWRGRMRGLLAAGKRGCKGAARYGFLGTDPVDSTRIRSGVRRHTTRATRARLPPVVKASARRRNVARLYVTRQGHDVEHPPAAERHIHPPPCTTCYQCLPLSALLQGHTQLTPPSSSPPLPRPTWPRPA